MRYRDMPATLRELADRLYEPLEDGRLWIAPCGHPASVMWVRDDGVVVCVAVLRETHTDHWQYTGICGDGCDVVKCRATYTADELPPAR